MPPVPCRPLREVPPEGKREWSPPSSRSPFSRHYPHYNLWRDSPARNEDVKRVLFVGDSLKGSRQRSPQRPHHHHHHRQRVGSPPPDHKRAHLSKGYAALFRKGDVLAAATAAAVLCVVRATPPRGSAGAKQGAQQGAQHPKKKMGKAERREAGMRGCKVASAGTGNSVRVWWDAASVRRLQQGEPGEKMPKHGGWNEKILEHIDTPAFLTSMRCGIGLQDVWLVKFRDGTEIPLHKDNIYKSMFPQLLGLYRACLQSQRAGAKPPPPGLGSAIVSLDKDTRHRVSQFLFHNPRMGLLECLQTAFAKAAKVPTNGSISRDPVQKGVFVYKKGTDVWEKGCDVKAELRDFLQALPSTKLKRSHCEAVSRALADRGGAGPQQVPSAKPTPRADSSKPGSPRAASGAAGGRDASPPSAALMRRASAPTMSAAAPQAAASALSFDSIREALPRILREVAAAGKPGAGTPARGSTPGGVGPDRGPAGAGDQPGSAGSASGSAPPRRTPLARSASGTALRGGGGMAGGRGDSSDVAKVGPQGKPGQGEVDVPRGGGGGGGKEAEGGGPVEDVVVRRGPAGAPVVELQGECSRLQRRINELQEKCRTQESSKQHMREAINVLQWKLASPARVREATPAPVEHVECPVALHLTVECLAGRMGRRVAPPAHLTCSSADSYGSLLQRIEMHTGIVKERQVVARIDGQRHVTRIPPGSLQTPLERLGLSSGTTLLVSESGYVTLDVRLGPSSKVRIRAYPDETVLSVKQALQRQANLAKGVHHMSLVTPQGRQVGADAATLWECGVRSGTVLLELRNTQRVVKVEVNTTDAHRVMDVPVHSHDTALAVRQRVAARVGEDVLLYPVGSRLGAVPDTLLMKEVGFNSFVAEEDPVSEGSAKMAKQVDHVRSVVAKLSESTSHLQDTLSVLQSLGMGVEFDPNRPDPSVDPYHFGVHSASPTVTLASAVDASAHLLSTIHFNPGALDVPKRAACSEDVIKR